MSFDFLPPAPKNNDQTKSPTSAILGGRNTAFKYMTHNGITDMRAYFENTRLNLPHNQNMINQLVGDDAVKSHLNNPTWFGANTTLEDLKSGYLQFSNPQMVTDALASFKSDLPIDLKNPLKKSKLMYNSRLGIFSFDRALIGMRRKKEYTNANNVVVEPEFVGNNQNGFFDVRNNDPLTQKNAFFDDGRPKVVTENKEVFALIDQVKTQQKSIEIVVNFGAASNVKAHELIWNGIAAIVLAEQLTMAGIKVAIKAAYCVTPDKDAKWFFCTFVNAKKYADTIDQNNLALLLSEPRVRRYDVFKAHVYTHDKFKTAISPSIGFPASAQKLRSLLSETGYSSFAKVEGVEVITLGDSRSREQSIKEYRTAIEKLKATSNE